MLFHYLTLNLACQDDPQIVTDAKKNDIYAVKKQIEEGACVDSLAAKRLVSFIKRENLTNLE